MEQDLKDAFKGIKTHITNENKHQDKAFDLFKKDHDKISKEYWKLVQKHDKEIYGTRGLLVRFAEMDIRTKIFGGVTGVAFVVTIILKVIGAI